MVWCFEGKLTGHSLRVRDSRDRYRKQSRLDLAWAGQLEQGSAGTENVDAKSHLDMQAVLNASVQQQRARIHVPAIVQGLTRRPAASDASVLHVQGAPAFALSA